MRQFALLCLSCILSTTTAAQELDLRLTTIVPNLAVVDMAHAGDGSGRLFLLQQNGTIRIWTGTDLLVAADQEQSARVAVERTAGDQRPRVQQAAQEDAVLGSDGRAGGVLVVVAVLDREGAHGPIMPVRAAERSLVSARGRACRTPHLRCPGERPSARPRCP